jgi:S-adenosylhomocysteine hydrolase
MHGESMPQPRKKVDARFVNALQSTRNTFPSGNSFSCLPENPFVNLDSATGHPSFVVSHSLSNHFQF